MIKEIIKSYNDSKYSFINKMAQIDMDIAVEVDQLDDSLIQSRVSGLKIEFNRTIQDIEILMKYDKKDEENRMKIRNLVDKKNDICLRMAFLASNSMNSLEACDELLENFETDFKLCIKALRFAREKEDDKALSHFALFFKDKKFLLDHYLINKTYGLLQYQNGDIETALIFLRKAVEMRPENLEIHQILKDIYQKLHKGMESEIEQNIIDVLEA